MANINFKQVGIWVVVIAGVACAVQTTLSLVRSQSRQKVLSPEETREMFLQSEAKDRENWEAMWKAAGRKAPSSQDHVLNSESVEVAQPDAGTGSN